MIPVLPFLCITAAVAVEAAARGLSAIVRLPSRMVGAVTASMTAVIILPSALNLVQLDDLLARTDNRLIAMQWVRDRVPVGASLYQSDGPYRGLALDRPEDRRRLDVWDFDEGRGVFTSDGETQARDPDWIVVQQAPIYSRVPPAIAALVASDQYVRVQSFVAIESSAGGSVYDRQDAFFLPLSGFRSINRPGPNFHVYQRSRPTENR
jgi:hypothetical protein